MSQQATIIIKCQQVLKINLSLQLYTVLLDVGSNSRFYRTVQVYSFYSIKIFTLDSGSDNSVRLQRKESVTTSISFDYPDNCLGRNKPPLGIRISSFQTWCLQRQVTY